MKNFKQKIIFVIYLTFLSLTSFAQSQDAKDEKGLRQGLWKGYYTDSKILRYVGNFNHGKEQGLFTYYANSDKNIVMATRNFDAKNNAYTIFFDENKNKVTEGNMINKLREGVWKYYHKNSKEIMTLENYKNDMLQGSRKVFYISGKLAEEINYKNNLKQGVSKKYSKKGILIEESTFNQGVLQGIYKVYEESGKIAINGQFNDDIKKGLWKYYKDGKLVRQVNTDTIKGITKPPIRKKE